MGSRKRLFWGIFGAIGMFVLILDAKASLKGALDGIQICLTTVIPSLFPFFIFSGLIQMGFIGQPVPLLRPIGKICGVPEGAEYLLLLGIAGGYPVGAQCIENACVNGVISKNDAQRMLGFCNNAGPAFIFGMAGALFSSQIAGWVLWGIQILSALVTGMLLPDRSQSSGQIISSNKISLTQLMYSALKAMATVCGWVILFRVLLYILDCWFLWLLPQNISVLVTGILELSNGCIALYQVSDPVFKFMAVSLLLVFGGVCVGIQTVSVAAHLNCKYYFLGKLLQLSVAVPLSALACVFLFPGNISIPALIGLMLIPLMVIGIYKWRVKNNSGNYALNGV